MSDRPRVISPGDPGEEAGSGASRGATRAPVEPDSASGGGSPTAQPVDREPGVIPLLTAVAEATTRPPADAGREGNATWASSLGTRSGYDGGTDSVDATEHLNSAISELEHVLSERHGVETGLTSVRETTTRSDPTIPATAQYSIPLLDEVVVPGSGSPGASGPRAPRPEALVDHTVELQALAAGAGAYRAIFERLASEIEVIVQAGVDEALRDAARAIRRRVNEHIEIILPEILDELSRKQRGDEE